MSVFWSFSPPCHCGCHMCMSPPQSERLRAVADILESYLRSICDLHAGQKAVRLEREVQFQQMSRLEVKARKDGGAGE